MNITQQIIQALEIALPSATVRFGIIEQGLDDNPPTNPYCIVQKTGSVWELDTTCSVERGLCQVSVQIDCYGLTAEASALMAQTVRNTLAGFPLLPLLEVELEAYEPASRLWRTAQSWLCWDDSPEIEIPSGTGGAFSSAYSSAYNRIEA